MTQTAAKSLKFPKDFLWGAATAAYQIEGAANEDGRGPSIWDTFSHTPGKVHNGDNGDVACDHYHRYKEDVELMKELGLNAYRFSISWPRILPEGEGKVNQKGLDFYNNLIDELLENGIEPFVTLYHWDLPQALQDKGGWENRETVDAFAEYARVCFERFGDRVKYWITFNEPNVFAVLGYLSGVHPPGMKDLKKAFRAAHNLLLAHARAVKAYREISQNGQIGITLNLSPVYPASDNEEEDKAAAERADQFNNWFLDPIFKGKYEHMLERLGEQIAANGGELPEITDEMEILSASLDFIGLNYYTSNLVRANPNSGSSSVKPPDLPRTDMGWEIYPEGLYDLLKRIHEKYNLPIYITENGMAVDDEVEDGAVHDTNRIDYLKEHLEAVHKAIEEGVNVRGYFVWSLMDNFEWANGYSKRFGLIYVDYKTQKRTPKKSAYWYREVIKSNGLELEHHHHHH
uniref:ANCESTRAL RECONSTRUCTED GLYCOSIDASE n=1 Tax=synthetic construct TaxID=32630 RepID=UPI0015D65F84|nr:Chain A, ANCESTRAL RECONSTRUCTED GLYCOSIDASE [synthetic construct]6Z1H_B Chain B, ANCESTRAL RECONSTRUCTED GLYCOSIDASE [synthetic construct]6Z1M_A Chain A, Ancestral reconstructed glycosidase [synthetic construct]6Z1M_B Chain B, Ancestral reconstructed glycosidase [synthetic construct]6Z1M_C Chain C, Ancestral reconstructed glycosidase [synthetic construct]